MPDQNSASSSFEMVTSKKSKKVNAKGIVIAILIVVLLTAGVIAGVLLVRQQQNIQEKAAVNLCPGAQACPVPGETGLLRDCNPANSDGTPKETSCSNIGVVGTISSCGSVSYCCPSLGASWTTDLTLCTMPTPSSTPTTSPTVTPTATPTSSASPGAVRATVTPLPTLSFQTTPRPIPVTGTDWPTVVGAGVGIGVIIISVLIAL